MQSNMAVMAAAVSRCTSVTPAAGHCHTSSVQWLLLLLLLICHYQCCCSCCYSLPLLPLQVMLSPWKLQLLVQVAAVSSANSSIAPAVAAAASASAATSASAAPIDFRPVGTAAAAAAAAGGSLLVAVGCNKMCSPPEAAAIAATAANCQPYTLASLEGLKQRHQERRKPAASASVRPNPTHLSLASLLHRPQSL